MSPKETHKFLIPDYYLHFSCKMGECRSACCVGWPISISMQNYYHLLGLDCRKQLRERLDCGLRMIDHPTEDEYARFEPRYDGNCPMRLQDGRCALHAELGEDILPDVCRLYPRGIRAEEGVYEASCANSCEAVLELLLKKREPISFSYQTLTLRMPPLNGRTSFFETLGMEQTIRLHLISIIQNRNLSLPQRILALGRILDRMDIAFANKDKQMLDCILREPADGAETMPQNQEQPAKEHLQFGLQIVEQMIEILDERSQSIRACGEATLAYFNGGDNAIKRYQTAKSHFDACFPHWEIFFEHMLVNHMFFSQFPFQDRPESMHNEYIALCAIYAILRFLGLGCMAERQDGSALTDGMAAAFRLVDHTEFDRYASHLLTKLKCTSQENLYDLLIL